MNTKLPIIVLALSLLVFLLGTTLSGCSISSPDLYTVTFDSQGGSAVAPAEGIKEGDPVSEPTEPTKDGYSFAGWYEDVGLTDAWDFASDTVTEAITLYAKWEGPAVGDPGPAGGYIFYDDEVGFDWDDSGTIESDEKDLLDGTNDGTVRGDRYLEAAPSDILVGGSEYGHIFGYHRVNGSSVLVGTSIPIGTGKTNTDALVAAMGDAAYTSSTVSTTTTTGDYAAKLADDYSLTEGGVTYDDWFLPSKDELNLMYQNLNVNSLGGFSDGNYWSSSENLAGDSWFQYFGSGGQYESPRDSAFRVRPVRAF